MILPVYPSRWVISPPDAVDDPDVFPFLSGQGFLEIKTPIWSTKRDVSVSGVDRVRALWSYPKWQFRVGYEVLRDATAFKELQRLLTFFNAHSGSTKAFFFLDRAENAVTATAMGTGDGATTVFQCLRTTTIGGITFSEPVRGFNGTPSFYVNGSLVTATVGALGVITFSVAPANASAITWTGAFMHLCRFTNDNLDVRQLMTGLWSGGGVEMMSVKP